MSRRPIRIATSNAGASSYLATPERDADFETLSGEPLQPLYTPEDVAGLDYDRDLGLPGPRSR